MLISEQVIYSQYEADEILSDINALEKQFLELKYWFTELEVSWQTSSEKNALSINAALDESIKKIENKFKEDILILKPLKEEAIKNIYNAVGAYIDNNRVLGNSINKQAQDLFQKIDYIIKSISDKHHNMVEQLHYETLRHASKALKATIIGSIIIVLFAIVWSAVILRSIITPMNKITDIMILLAKGELDQKIPNIRKGELGMIVTALEYFKQQSIREREHKEEKYQEQKRKEIRQHNIDKLIHEFDSVIRGIVDTLSLSASNLKNTAQNMSINASNTKEKSSNLTFSIKTTLSNVSLITQASQEMSSSIQDISRTIEEANDVAVQALNKTETINYVSASLSDATNKIEQVLDFITYISSQINLLSLNATIEAARVGEVGKGFAVVAAEIKNLVNQTGNSTQEISNKVKNIQIVSKEAIQVINAIKDTINNISNFTNVISHSMVEQNISTRSISSNINATATAVKDIVNSIESVNELNSLTEHISNQVLDASSELANQSVYLKDLVSKFLQEIHEL